MKGSSQDTREDTGNVFSGSSPGRTLVFTHTRTARSVSTLGQQRKQRREPKHSRAGKDEVRGTRVKPLNKLTRQTSFSLVFMGLNASSSFLLLMLILYCVIVTS